ncbi:MAG: hypothetical protein AAGC44_01130 [Planctomycetota bacterium]
MRTPPAVLRNTEIALAWHKVEDSRYTESIFTESEDTDMQRLLLRFVLMAATALTLLIPAIYFIPVVYGVQNESDDVGQGRDIAVEDMPFGVSQAWLWEIGLAREWHNGIHHRHEICFVYRDGQDVNSLLRKLVEIEVDQRPEVWVAPESIEVHKRIALRNSPEHDSDRHTELPLVLAASMHVNFETNEPYWQYALVLAGDQIDASTLSIPAGLRVQYGKTELRRLVDFHALRSDLEAEQAPPTTQQLFRSSSNRARFVGPDEEEK